ncbi:Protein disulfide-isomerase [Golovinomyces cichoracearum]|uniref:Protein disulfide-isomerase n=1 Tax=Golovinomyces cichoracearum TaxID=62708 RepID=A0A420J623_9PEZI|nr:Protein disulfide-isomerase [Golovinomyces cichoracearum]
MRNLEKLALGLVTGVVASGASEVTSLTKDTFKDYIKDNDLALSSQLTIGTTVFAVRSPTTSLIAIISKSKLIYSAMVVSLYEINHSKPDINLILCHSGHCKALAPEFEEAAKELKKRSVKLAKIDCTEEAELCQTHGVDGYPTLKIFRGSDNVKPYSGGRKAPAIISHMTKQSLPAVSILTQETIEDFKKADQIVTVAYFDAEDKTSNSTFTALAEKIRDTHIFGASNDANLAKSEGVTVPAVVLYKSFDEGKVVHTGKFEEEEIEKFINTASIPLVGTIDPDTYHNYMFSGVPLAYIFAKTEDERISLSKTLRPVAEKHRGKINFATIDAEAYGSHATNLNLKADNFPAFVIHDTVNNKKYPLHHETEITAESIDDLATKFTENKIEPSIKSEPIPESQTGPVTVVVAKTFDEIVMDDTKDVLIEFYATWCGHCKALAPKYEILAKLYADAGLTDKVTIAKIDADANDVNQEIEGFPTIMLFKAGDKANPVTFSGGRNVEDLIKFVKLGKHEVSVEYGVDQKEKEPSEPEETEDEEVMEDIDIDDDEMEEHDEL